MHQTPNGQSFTVYDSNGIVLVSALKTIKVPTIGTLRLQEALTESYITQTFTNSRQADGWYISFSVDAEKIPPIIHEVAEPVGIEYDLPLACKGLTLWGGAVAVTV
ncbi:hypothetical protein F7734_02265 [Scytonema sp. UIC 10036]|uniref:hypothetical protein n=1 Tax=Scytonema sp. UIC 10036 TaxID=2304196 RepID=UPI0012DA5264|nr:hypothetical protein [Scytonema sp. UIC 10036]MUG91375.1 hypothetical protein [Scytonema sp. UIC 10036]